MQKAFLITSRLNFFVLIMLAFNVLLTSKAAAAHSRDAFRSHYNKVQVDILIFRVFTVLGRPSPDRKSLGRIMVNQKTRTEYLRMTSLALFEMCSGVQVASFWPGDLHSPLISPRPLCSVQHSATGHTL